MYKPYLAECHTDISCWRDICCLLTGESICVSWRIQIFDVTDFQRRARNAERQRNPLGEINEKMAWKTHNCRMGKAWRCVTLEEASSLLLPWQWSLLGNCVAMARVSSVMQTWPHPPTSSPAVKSREASLLTVCQCWEQRGCVYVSVYVCVCACVCVCEIACFLFFCCCFLFFLQAANLSLHGTAPQPRLSLLSAPLTHDPSPFQGGVSSPGAGTNTGCAETVHRLTSFSRSSFLVSDLFSLAVEPDTLWQCALRRLTQYKTLHRLHFSNIEAGTCIQHVAIRDFELTISDWLSGLLVLCEAHTWSF